MSTPAKTQPSTVDVILFYNSVDRDEVDEVYRELKRRGLKPWMDTKDLQPGEEWQEKIGEVICAARSAAVFYGSSGQGHWRSEEIQAALREFKKTNRKMIPVWLPSAKQPTSAEEEDASDDAKRIEVAVFVDNRHRVTFSRGIGDPDAYDVLEWGITDKDPRKVRGLYQIQVEVPKAEQTCFIAFPPDGPEELYEIITQALAELKIACSPFSEPSKLGTPEELTQAIRGSELVIAVCIPDPTTGRPAPCTMFLLGHSMALGKPILRVTSDGGAVPPVVAYTPVVEYMENDLFESESLQQQLVEKIGAIVADLRHPFLVEPHRQDVSVAYVDMSRIPVAAWDKFEAVLSFGLTVYRRFRHVGKHVHMLHRDIEDCLESANEISDQEAIERNWRVFQHAYEEFDLSDCPEPGQFFADDDEPVDTRVPEALDYLRDHTTDPLRKTAVKTADYYRKVLNGIRRYFAHVGFVPPLVHKAASAAANLDDPAQRDLHEDHVANLEMYLNRLAGQIQVIEMQTCAMMTGLLAFFGTKQERTR
ncbi:MAG: toll/interleukin-1 receptor domain-containing protein [Planctomycetes bacterium]|nr:toll/interleukin-1 receptor domain-containing protein [Planctomycetota bacterium]